MAEYQASLDEAAKVRNLRLINECGEFYAQPPSIGMLKEILLDCSSYALQGRLREGWSHKTASGLAEEYRVIGGGEAQIIIKNGRVASIYQR